MTERLLYKLRTWEKDLARRVESKMLWVARTKQHVACNKTWHTIAAYRIVVGIKVANLINMLLFVSFQMK